MSRLLGIGLPALLFAFGALGCERREPVDPHEFVAEETARATGEADIVVVTGEADVPVAPGEAPSGAPSTRLRHTISLGYAGDGPLTDVHSEGYDDGGHYAPMPYYAPTPYYGFGGVSHRFGGGAVHRGFGGGSPHGTFHGGGTHSFHGGGGSRGGHGGGGHGGR